MPPVQQPQVEPAPPLPAVAAKAEDLEALRKSIEDTAAVGGGLWLSYLFVLFYLGIAASAVTHIDLFVQNPVKLPFLNIELPLLAFFFLAPLLFVITHAYTLVNLALLADRVKQFHNELRDQLADPALASRASEIRAALARQLPSNIFVRFLGGPDEIRNGPFGALLAIILWVTLVIAPIALLLLLQIQFLPYHSRWITWTARVALILDLGLLWWLWRNILDSGANRADARRWRSWAQTAIATVLSMSIILFAGVVATIPGEWGEPTTVGWGIRNTLILPEFNLYEALKIDDPQEVAWKHYLIDLKDRDLRGASLDRAILTNADLRGARLQSASLDHAQLQGASLDYAQLQGASLASAQLQGASLEGAFVWRVQPSDSVVENIFAPAAPARYPPNWGPEYAAEVDSKPEAWTGKSYAALRQSIEQSVPQGDMRNAALERVSILDCAQKGDTLASCDASADPPEAVKKWKKMIEAASVDQVIYAKALAAALGDLVCSNEPGGIEALRGLLRSRRLLQTGGEMSVLAKRITGAECPVSAALTEADKRALAEASENAASLAKSP